MGRSRARATSDCCTRTGNEKKGIKGKTCKQNKVNKKIGKVAGRSVGRYPVDCRRHGNISEYQLVLPDQRNVLRLKNQQKRLC